MRSSVLFFCVGTVLLGLALVPAAEGQPYVNGRFQGRIAYSADGNHNDPDDWIASPMTLAILAEAGLKDRLVHFDYNCILPLTNPEWERIHAQSVLGAAERYGFDRSVFFDDRKDLDGAVASIARAINASSADNPLYFILAGPMEVPLRGILKSDPAQRRFVYCISHSRWNDGFASRYRFTCTKRSVIEQDVGWVQIRDQNTRLSFGRYGQPARPEEFRPYFWMRDAPDAKVRFLWDRMVVSTRPDPSDAGMTWFLVSGDEQCDPLKLKRLLEDHQRPVPVTARHAVRLEAENFRHLEGFALEDRDRAASHQLNVVLSGTDTIGRIRTRWAEPYIPLNARYDVEVRFKADRRARSRLTLLVNGVPRGPGWGAAGVGAGWQSHVVRDVPVQAGDEIAVEIHAGPAERIRLDYVELRRRQPNAAPAPASALPATSAAD